MEEEYSGIVMGADYGSIRDRMIEAERCLEAEGLWMRIHGSLSVRLSDEDTFYYAGDTLREGELQHKEIRRVRPRFATGMEAVHAAIYRARPETGAVIFTRQCFGSVLGVIAQDGIAAEDAEGRTVRIRVVPFALPGSDAQRAHVRRLAAKERSLNFIIASNHGVFSFGESVEEAASSARMLEEYAKLYLGQLGHLRPVCGVERGFDSLRTPEGGIRYVKRDTPARMRILHERIYALRPDVGAIIHDQSETARTVSRLNERLYPLFDDFVRLAGPGVRIPSGEADARDAVYVSGDCNVAVSKGDGILCFGRDETMASFVARAVERNCVAQLAGARMGGAHVITPRNVRRLRRLGA